MYHHVNKKAEDTITVDIFKFAKDMLSISDKEVVYLDDYDPLNSNQVVITFDDGYKDVLLYALPILKKFKYPFEIFLVGNFYNGAQKGNINFLNKEELEYLKKHGGRLQYHTKSHPHLEEISDCEKLETEIKPPENMLQLDENGFNYFAYPFCTFNNKVIEITKKYYKSACSGKNLGDDKDKYKLERLKVENHTIIKNTKLPFCLKLTCIGIMGKNYLSNLLNKI